jgi:penicillin-insensitive murein endopeptidase
MALHASADPSQPAEQREAKKVFGAVKSPAGGPAQAIGEYNLGCVAGAQPLPLNGPSWQVMRLSRNRIFGHPRLIAFIERLANDVHRLDGWPGILVGDMAQPIGGPLVGGHASHQIGLDADLWYKPMPARRMTAAEREELAADDLVDKTTLTVNKTLWTDADVRLLRRAASYPEVARIFVHPAIKKALCEAAGADRAWLSKIRPWWQHNDHFHVRLNCPDDSPGCVPQAPVAQDDGCGKELDTWFARLRAPPPAKPQKPSPPPKPILLSAYPKACQELVASAEGNSHGKAASAH